MGIIPRVHLKSNCPMAELANLEEMAELLMNLYFFFRSEIYFIHLICLLSILISNYPLAEPAI